MLWNYVLQYCNNQISLQMKLYKLLLLVLLFAYLDKVGKNCQEKQRFRVKVNLVSTLKLEKLNELIWRAKYLFRSLQFKTIRWEIFSKITSSNFYGEEATNNCFLKKVFSSKCSVLLKNVLVKMMPEFIFW